MEDNNKLFVFEKKEIILIFVFIVLIAVISFTLGVRTGKQLSLKNEGYTQEDVKNIDLKSIDEEYVEDVVDKSSASNFEQSVEQDKPKKDKGTVDVMESRLREEMELLAKEKMEKTVEAAPVQQQENIQQGAAISDVNPTKEEVPQERQISGKYTIQLFSHQSRETAEEFADGFILKGYDVIINEVVIPGKGKWYRVGIGAFDTFNQAEDYLQKEKALFQKNSYIIQKI